MIKEILDSRTKAFSSNSGEAYYALAQCYEDINQFGDPNPYFDNFRRIFFYLKAGHLGYADAYNNLANLIEVDMRNIKNYRQRAKTYYKLASDMGSEFGRENYALFLKQEEFPNSLKLVVTLVGEKLDHQTVTTMLKVNPTAFWSKGDDIRKFKYSYGNENTSWQYEFSSIETMEFNPIVDLVKTFLGSKTDTLIDYIAQNSLVTYLDVLVDLNYGNMPMLNVNNEFIKIVERLNGTINFRLLYFDGFVDEN